MSTFPAHLLDVTGYTTADGVGVGAGDVVWEADNHCAVVKRRVVATRRQYQTGVIPFRPYGFAESQSVYSTQLIAQNRVLARMELELAQGRRRIRSLASSIETFKKKMALSPRNAGDGSSGEGG